MMSVKSLLCLVLLGTLWQMTSSLKCYRCYSNQEGCGKMLNIRLNRLESCPSLPKGAGENFCVKVVEKRGSEEYYTRECLSTLRIHTEHRQKIPTVQRHGYCSPARNNDPYDRWDENTHYCFCNDWNGCNGASSLTFTVYTGLLFALISTVMRALCAL